MPKIDKYLFRLVLASLIAAWLLVVTGCKPKSTFVGGIRDADAVPIRLHNRTTVDLIIIANVRVNMETIPIHQVLRIPPQGGQLSATIDSDEEVKLFENLPSEKFLIGSFGIDIGTSETEVRLGVIDFSKKDMEKAMAAGRITVVFREKGAVVSIGFKSRFVPYLRSLPNPRNTIKGS